MSWNGMSGNGGIGFFATEHERIAAVQKKNEEFAASRPVEDPKPSIQAQVEEYALSLSEKEAEETIDFCIYLAKTEGYVSELLQWIRDNGFETTQDLRIQAAALEYGKNLLS